MRMKDLCGRALLAAALLAVWPAAARADGCFVDKEPGTCVCNCTDGNVSVSLCTGSSITVSGEQRVDSGLVIPGLSAYFGTKYSQSVAVTEQTCFTTTLAPGTCVHLLYLFKVCVYTTWEDGWFGPTQKSVVTIAFLGVSIEDRPAEPDDCADT